MKILISNDGTHAHLHERLAWVNAFRSCGIDANLYDCKLTPAFDVFNAFEPDIFIGQLYNIDRATYKCILNRPHMKVALRGGDWCEDKEYMSNPHILTITDQQKEILNGLLENNRLDYIYTHYLQSDIEKTHSEYKCKLVGIPMSADINTYLDAEFDPALKCEIGFVGGYWPYKAQTFDKYLLPILSKYRVKIFGNQMWPVNEYCGIINDRDVKNLFKSADICPNLSEPHAHTYGFDLNERIFKVVASGGFCISDYIEAGKQIFGDSVVFAHTPNEFEALVKHYIRKPLEREELVKKARRVVFDSHTNYDRISTILEGFGIDLYNEIMKVKYSILEHSNVNS